MTTRPTPRPALRKAPDSEVHPAEPRAGVVPLHGSTSDAQRSQPRNRPVDPMAVADPTPETAGRDDAGADADGADGAAAADATTGTATPSDPDPATPTPRRRVSELLRRSTDSPRGDDADSAAAPAGRDLRRRKGSATSDVLRGSARDKLVDADVRVPKSLRKRLRQEAKRRGVTPDELATLLLRDYLEP